MPNWQMKPFMQRNLQNGAKWLRVEEELESRADAVGPRTGVTHSATSAKKLLDTSSRNLSAPSGAQAGCTSSFMVPFVVVQLTRLVSGRPGAGGLITMDGSTSSSDSTSDSSQCGCRMLPVLLAPHRCTQLQSEPPAARMQTSGWAYRAAAEGSARRELARIDRAARPDRAVPRRAPCARRVRPSTQYCTRRCWV
jgi:hypothetical protein